MNFSKNLRNLEAVICSKVLRSPAWTSILQRTNWPDLGCRIGGTDMLNLDFEWLKADKNWEHPKCHLMQYKVYYEEMVDRPEKFTRPTHYQWATSYTMISGCVQRPLILAGKNLIFQWRNRCHFCKPGKSEAHFLWLWKPNRKSMTSLGFLRSQRKVIIEIKNWKIAKKNLTYFTTHIWLKTI